MKFLWMVALIGFAPDGNMLEGSGISSAWTESDCTEISLAYSRKHELPLEQCVKIREDYFHALSETSATFVWE